MAKLIYRVISPCSALGCGFPTESLDLAIEGRVDAIVCDAGTAQAGPFFLGTGTSSLPTLQIRADLERIVAAAHRIGCPVIIGSAGTAGGDRNVAALKDVLADIFDQLVIENASVATVSAEVSSEDVIVELGRGNLTALGAGITLSEETLRETTIVGQMGVHPTMSALDSGAQYVIAGRACGASLFAADMIRKGIGPGLAYHAGKILASGALACEPASAADSLVCEVYDDGSAFFMAPSPTRRCTVQSLAAHSLYREPHPHIHPYPEGTLDTGSAQFHARDARVAGISGSRLLAVRPHGGIKLEGVRWLGYRKVSLLHIDPSDIDFIPKDLPVYGRNAVQLITDSDATRDYGILIETTAATPDSAVLLATSLRDHLHRIAFPGRKGSAGNLAHPISPHALRFRRPNGTYGALIICGTADPIFFKLLRRVEVAVVEQIEAVLPQAFAYASHTITALDSNYPAVLVATVSADAARLTERHEADIARVSSVAPIKPPWRLKFDAPDAYAWSLFHVLRNDQLIRDKLFEITQYAASGRTWTTKGAHRPTYIDIAESNVGTEEDPLITSGIDYAEPRGVSLGSQRLIDMAAVVRSVNAGINRLSFDIFFISGEAYEAALSSNAFSRESIASQLRIDPDRIMGTYFADACNAIKITIERPVAGNLEERDLYGEQQHAVLEELRIPIYSTALISQYAF